MSTEQLEDILERTIALDVASMSPTMRDRYRAALAQAEQPVAVVRHKKRGTEYEVVGIGMMQSENWVALGAFSVNDQRFDFADTDMEEVTIYRSIDDRQMWVRPRKEFEDGRFETLAHPPAKREAGELLREALDALEEIASKDREGFGRPALGAVARRAIRSIKPRAALEASHE